MLRPIVEVLDEYDHYGRTIDQLGTGLINQTWIVATDREETYVLQCVNPVFPESVNEDIAKVTEHLRAKGLLAPEIQRNCSGSLTTEYAGDNWRLMSFIEGVSFDCLSSVEQAREAGAALAAFHQGVSDLDMTFSHQRPHVHDTRRHIESLRTALEAHGEHERFAKIEPLAMQILQRVDALPELPATPDRLVHGDPKISNLLFDQQGKALCWIDLDTLAHMALPLEMGDAYRSWCNPTSEDAPEPEFRLDYFAAAAEGYASGSEGFVTEAEWRAFADGTEIILVELAARFCADALNESYFGWDSSRFATRGEHNEVRAGNQLKVLESFLAQRAEVEAALEKAFS